MAEKTEDEVVMGTNDEASVVKAAAVSLGYYDDPFISTFVPQQKTYTSSPLLRRGYYTRVAAIRRVVSRFFAQFPSSPTQLVVLGCGFDTLSLRLLSAHAHLRAAELDFAAVTRRKEAALRRQADLLLPVLHADRDADEVQWSGSGSVRASRYALCPVDLRRLDDVAAALAAHGFSRDVPTLLLSECVLIYLDMDASRALLQWAAGAFARAVCVCYEQIRPHDAFGRQMVANLRARGLELRSLEACPTIDAQMERLKAAGWAQAVGWDMVEVTRRIVDERDSRRLAAVEALDEFEEWNLIQAHYSLVISSNQTTEPISSFI